MNASYTPIRPLFRSLFAAAALTATFTCGAFIDSLAGRDAPGSLQGASIQVAEAHQ